MAKLFMGGSTLSYAHLAGIIGGKKKSRVEDAPSDDDKDKSKTSKAAGEGDDEDDTQRAEDQDREDGDQDKARAEDDDDDENKDDEDKKSKKSKASDDDECDEDDEDEMHGKGAAAQARRREQSRISAILGSRAAVRAPTLAAHLALNTRMTRGAALAALKDAPKEASVGGSSRADRNPDLGPGGERDAGGPSATATRWDKHMSKAQAEGAKGAGKSAGWDDRFRRAAGR